MSREIKYRGFIKPKIEDGEVIYTGGIENISRIIFEYNKAYVEYVGWFIIDVDIILLQYTGEHDDNGIEIYEGDIIQEEGWDNRYIVEFKEGKYIGIKIRKPNGDIFTNYNHDLDWFSYPIVLGNKFDNPELLEVEAN